MLDRHVITDKLKEALEPLPFIYAFWLEGADANGTVDEYSDIDFWVDFEDEYEEQAYDAVETSLSELAVIDYKYISRHPHSKIRQRTYHLTGTSEYLTIDFCWQFHSRDDGALIVDGLDKAKVLFDKRRVVRYEPVDCSVENAKRLEKALHHRKQYARVVKYIRRGQYLEAYSHYNHYVLEPLIELLRLIYTPVQADYGFCHISQHIPTDERERLEYFTRIGSLDDINEKIPQAAKWFDKLVERIELK